MIGPDHRTQFILYLFYGVHDRGSRPRQEVDVILAWNCVVIYVLCEACIVKLENARSVIFHEMTNNLMCMNPVKTTNNCCRLKRLRG